jgi:MGT family glycosyltransferase
MAGEVEEADPPDWLTILPHRPTVYLTLGTVWNTELDVFRLVIDAIAGDDLNLIVTVGRNNEPAALGPQPANVIVKDFVPQHQILGHCDLVVTHGGSGTILGALAFGLPVLVLPQGADQWSNAERVVAAGAGRSLIGDEISKAAIQDTVAMLLADPTFRGAAENIRAQIRSMPAPADVLQALESLLSDRNGAT